MLTMRRNLLLLVFLLLALPFAHAHAQSVVYAITQNGAFGTLNLTSGAFTQLGSAGATPTGLGGLGSNLFLGADSTTTLYFVNPASGNLSTIGLGSFPGYNDFGSTTSGLYAIGTDNNLYLLNPQNGGATLLGSPGVNLNGASGLSSNSGTLYLTVDTGSGSVLYSVNTSNGSATTIGNTGVRRIVSMVYANDVLYGANNVGNLYTLNTSTAAATLVANTGQDIYGMAALATLPTPLRLVNVTPCRLVDTRQQNNGNGFQGTMTFNLPQIAMNGGNMGQCMPFNLATAQAYSLNVTLAPINHQPVGYLTIWPTGETQPLVSLENSDGRTKANAAIVPAGTGGAVNVYVTNTTNMLIDIDAYFDSASDNNALAFFPLPPCRLVDTRNGQNGGTLQAGQERDYTIPGLGNCGIPSNASAYSFNVTVIPAPGGLDYLTVWPESETRPVVSTLNASTSDPAVANAAIVPAGPNNKTAFYPNSNNTDLLVDTNGYFAPASSGTDPLSLFTLTPCRVLDTRGGLGEFTGTIPVGVAGSTCGIPGNSTSEAFVFNATVVPDAQTHLGYLTLWPEGGAMPGVSTLNAYDGAITSNMAIVPAGEGNDSIDAFAGEQDHNYTNLILDISSYFAAVPPLAIQNFPFLPDAECCAFGYSVTLSATGGVPPYSWSLKSGALPPGLTLNSSGTISGTPTTGGTYNFTVQVNDSDSPAGIAMASLQIIVTANPGNLTIISTSVPNGTVNTLYSTVLAASGGITPYAWNVIAGNLPLGLSLSSSTGQIIGTPQSTELSQFTVKVTDNIGESSTATFSIAIDTGAANGTLNGMYAFSFTGYNANSQTPFVVAGSLALDGNGHVTGGEYDFNQPTANGGYQHSTITAGSYTLSSNGLGQLNFTDNTGANIQMLIAVGDEDDSRVVSMNTSGSGGFWGAGVFRQQNPSDFFVSLGAGNWAFSYQGFDSSTEPLAGAGSYTEDSSGNINNGAQDINDFGTHIQTTFTGHLTGSPPIDSNGRTTVQYQVSGVGTVNLAVYIISYGQLVGIETDSGSNIYVTNAIRQTPPFTDASLSGSAVGRGSRQHGAGGGSPNSQATVLLIQGSNGNVTVNLYQNTGGTVSSGTMTGTYSVSSNGRAPLNFSDGSQVVCYLLATNEGYCVNTVPASGNDVKGAESIFFEPQVGGPFGLASLTGEYSGGSLPQYVSSTAGSIDSFFTDGGGNASFTGSESGPGGIQGQTGLGTYSVSNSGLITVMSGGNAYAYGYVVNPYKFDLISTDDNPRLLIHVTSDAP